MRTSAENGKLVDTFCNVVYYWEQCGKISYMLKIGYMVDEYCMKYILKIY